MVANRPEWAAVLLGLRRGRGWSQADLARALRQEASRANLSQAAGIAPSSVTRCVIRWENGEAKPDSRYQLLLVRAYARRGDQILIGPTSELEHLMAAFEMMGVTVDRREWLRAMATSLLAVGANSLATFFAPTVHDRLKAALEKPSKVDHETLELIQETIIQVRQARDHVHNMELLLGLAPHLLVIKELLKASQPQTVRQELCSIAVQAFGTAARYSWGLWDFGSAQRYYRCSVD